MVKVHDTSMCTVFNWVALLAMCAVRCISEANGHCVHSQFTTHMVGWWSHYGRIDDDGDGNVLECES